MENITSLLGFFIGIASLIINHLSGIGDYADKARKSMRDEFDVVINAFADSLSDVNVEGSVIDVNRRSSIDKLKKFNFASVIDINKVESIKNFSKYIKWPLILLVLVSVISWTIGNFVLDIETVWKTYTLYCIPGSILIIEGIILGYILWYRDYLKEVNSKYEGYEY